MTLHENCGGNTLRGTECQASPQTPHDVLAVFQQGPHVVVWRRRHIVHHEIRPDGTAYDRHDTGETSEGCIMWLADQFATQRLGITAREVYQSACRQHDDDEFEDDWVATDALRDAWASHTILPRRWTATRVRKLFEDLEDVNYHSFLARLIELIEQRLPELAAQLPGWCRPTTHPSSLPVPLNDPV